MQTWGGVWQQLQRGEERAHGIQDRAWRLAMAADPDGSRDLCVSEPLFSFWP